MSEVSTAKQELADLLGDKDPERVVIPRWLYQRLKFQIERIVAEHDDPRCTVDVGSRPSWMSPDQYDPCRCLLPKGHVGNHTCGHTEKSRA